MTLRECVGFVIAEGI
jgi:hypothetical protein